MRAYYFSTCGSSNLGGRKTAETLSSGGFSFLIGLSLFVISKNKRFPPRVTLGENITLL
ncbi:hypothetical protein REC12_13345 [Desulfosporosinus sp. PR]|nr:hypothetical protein [Desulfosporosinus sp. PR]